MTMTRMIVWTSALVVLAGLAPAHEQELAGRKITLRAGAHMSLDVPCALPYDGPVPDGRVAAVEGKTGKRFPVTVRDGELVFVPEGALAGTVHYYTLERQGETQLPAVRIEKVEGEDAVEVHIRDRHFTTYHYAKTQQKPFLWPVVGPGGEHITRDWPMGEKALTEDHPHHVSGWTAHGDVNGYDFWHKDPQVPVNVTWGSGDAYGWIRSENVWTGLDGKEVVKETREYRFYASDPRARLFDVTVTFEAAYGEVVFGDTKEGGIVALRVNDAITEKAGGSVVNSAGGKGSGECWGKPAAWVDFSGELPESGMAGVAVFDSPENPGHPTTWHARDYGLLAANCFGLSDFLGEGNDGSRTLAAGNTMTFRYRVYVHKGDTKQARVADRHADFATPPAVSWE
jgi:hypothetical protein